MKKLLIKLFGVVASALLLAITVATLVRHQLVRNHGASVEETTGVLSYLSPTAHWLAGLPQNLYHSLTNPFSFQFIVEDRFPGYTGFVGEPNQQERYLLQSRVDGDMSRPVVELVDLRTFEVQHTWIPDLQAFADIWNNETDKLNDSPLTIDPSSDLIVHPMIVSGDLVFNAEHSTMKRVDACSNLVWQAVPTPHEVFHHSIQADIDGNLWSLGANFHRLHPGAMDGFVGRYYEDHSIVKLHPSGEVLFAKSISDILTENGLGYLMWGHHYAAYTGDWLHANEVEPANSDTKYWRKGDVLISLLSPSLVLLYRPSTNKLIWHSIGYAYAQHDPNFVDDSRISIFDNNTPYGSRPTPLVDDTVVDESVWSSEHSQVIVYDFATQKYSSYLNDSLREQNVQGYNQSRSDILPNGDLFVEETPNSRILYFNADGSLRWSHVNRANNGNIYTIGWSRILYRDHDIEMVRDFLKNKDELLAACKEPN